MKLRGGVFGLLALALCGAGSIAAAPGDSPPVLVQDSLIEHALISSYIPGAKLAITASVKDGADWVTLYYRAPGLQAFQARPMARDGQGPSYSVELDTSALTADGFEYYIEAEKGGRKTVVPADGAAGPAPVKPEGGEPAPRIPENLPSPQDEETKLKLPIHANGSAQGTLREQASGPAVSSPAGSGNIQIGFESSIPGKSGLRIDSNFSLTNAPPAGGSEADLSNMMIAVTSGSHALRLGDININESEYTSFGLGRRGIEYAFDNRKLYLHAFDVSSQQVQGFKGFGIPARAVSLMGGAAGLRLFGEGLSLRAIYVTGRDDPSRAANAAVSSSLQSREGDAWAVMQETSLFRSAVKLRAEFARSRYDGDTGDEAGAAPDTAWSAGASLSLGRLSLNGTYRFIGRTFNSVGLQYLANDRQGVDANLLWSLGPFSLQGQVTAQRDNVESDDERPTTEGLSGNASVNLALGSKLSLTAGLRASDQKSRQGGASDLLQDAATLEYSGGLAWTASSALSLNLTLTRSSLKSETNPTGDIRGMTLNIGGSLRAGEALMISPTFGLTRSESLATGAVDTTLNAFLNGEVFFIPRVLSILLSGSFNRMAQAVVSVSRAVDATGGINFYLGKLIKVNSLLLTVRGSYRRQEYGGQPVTDTRIYGQADIAF